MITARKRKEPAPRLVSRRLSFGIVLGMVLTAFLLWFSTMKRTSKDKTPLSAAGAAMPKLEPRWPTETSGLPVIAQVAERWRPDAPLSSIRQCWDGATERAIEQLDRQLASPRLRFSDKVVLQMDKASCYMSAGKPEQAQTVLQEIRADVERRGGQVQQRFLAILIYYQGVASLRRGENENCIMCRGESSCILPIGAAAVHKNIEGSRKAIGYFTEYLQYFPDDLEVRWLLNLAHMTLGEHPGKVDPQYILHLDDYFNSEFDIGKFRDIGHLVGVNRFNQSGGAIMEDFDNDGLLDLAVSSFDQTEPLGLYRNTGDGKFVECAIAAGVDDQLGGLVCVQTDYNNDGLMDIYIPRGAWLTTPIRPSLLRNDGRFHFTDVTEEAGLLNPVNSNAAAWADYDNDGWLDLFVACERQSNRLYRNLGNGKFKDVTVEAHLATNGQSLAKGCAWIDYDNDDDPDLFVNNLEGNGQLHRNNRDGTFSDVSSQLGIFGPRNGFACWAWDYDNDGWLDIFATCYQRTLGDVVKGLMGLPHSQDSNMLLRNLRGERFQDVTRESGLDKVFSTMGCNFGDFDNDGFLDMYLGTGEPNLSTLVPNRMFKNLAGKRFTEITSSAGVGHLQKGHGVACGDWDRDGNVDVFIQMGGAVKGDRYHNILFQNPGHNHRWLTLKLVGQRTNRAAIGARIKVVTAGNKPLTAYRHVSSGSSFGGNPLEQTIGLADAESIAALEIHWPTSGTTQVFRNLAVNQVIEVTELSEDCRIVELERVPSPQ